MKIYDEEKAILEGLASHDSNAIERIYRDNYSLIQSFIIKNNGYPEDARDIFQEAIVVLFENARSGSFELTCQIRTYLYSVCRRLWFKRLQQNARHQPAFEINEETTAIEDDLEIHEKRDQDFMMMEKAMAKLGEPCRGLIEAFYIHKKTMPEIADMFGYTNADNAKNQKYKCMMRLKKLFFTTYKNGEENG